MRTTVSARAGKRVALVLLFGGLAAFVAACTIQLIQQVFFTAGSITAGSDVTRRNASEPAFVFGSCREGLVALHAAVVRARGASEGESDVEQALGRFRGALQPEWGRFEAVRAACQSNEPDQHSLDAVERLRYAEEHAVRREAGSLEVLRKQVANELLGAKSASNGSPPASGQTSSGDTPSGTRTPSAPSAQP